MQETLNGLPDKEAGVLCNAKRPEDWMFTQRNTDRNILQTERIHGTILAIEEA
jgi:hypothetical protein